MLRKPNRFVILAVTIVTMGTLVTLGGAQAQEAPPVGAAPGSADELTLRPGDILQVNIWPDASLSGSFTVEETGLVQLPFLGGVQVTGMPISQLRSQLRASYSEIMKEPVVTITPYFQVGVSGGVRSPGNYRITPAENIVDLILTAGGFTDNAKEDQIEIVREGQVLKYNVERALEQAADLDALTLRSGDQVVVPVGGNFSFRDFTAIFSFAVSTALLVASLVDSGSSSSDSGSGN